MVESMKLSPAVFGEPSFIALSNAKGPDTYYLNFLVNVTNPKAKNMAEGVTYLKIYPALDIG